ncbi:MAG TPA: GDSL-type esterase/lipase family protein [Polyangiales bacterium]|nr:GDSL-type esterase/lipase family protein [Polyangiales bacterium]
MARQIVKQTVVLACLLCACGDAETSRNALRVEATNAQVAEPGVPDLTVKRAGLPKVAVLGDSIGAGQFLSEQQAFPSVVERQLRALGKSVALVNASVPADTTADGLRRVDWLLRQEPKVVLVELGENDKSQAVPVREVEANLRAILAKVRGAGAQALLLGVSSEPSRDVDRAYARELAAIYPRIADELSVTFVPFLQGVAGHRELTLPDGVHPTPEGHERIAGHLIDPLRLLLSK